MNPLLGSFELIGFLIGLFLGSFLNVCIVRVPRGESVVSPRSHCRLCGHVVRWYDNLPVLSWLLLRGKCRDCGARISWRYPAVELAIGLWFLFAAIRIWGPLTRYGGTLPSRCFGIEPSSLMILVGNPELVGFAILGFILIGLIAIDWEWHRLPDEFTLGGIAAGMFLVCVQAIFLQPGEDQVILNSTHQLRLSSPGSFAAKGNVFLTGPEALVFGRLAAVVGAALILLIVRWAYKAMRKRDGLGLGDVKMLAMVAAFLGFWPAVLTLLLGTMLASAYGIALMARGKAHGLTKLPLGSFLGVAGLFVALFGDGIIWWYRGLVGLG